MGCSASRLDTFIEKAIEDPSFSLSSFSSSSTKPRSLWAPLVHHPAVHKGDSHHIVSLTSSTYGSLNNHPTATVDGGGCGGGEQPSPDSVINTWELMEGLEEIDESSEFNHDLKVESFSNCDFDGTQKIPNLKLGFNCGLGNDLKVESLSYCDFNDAQKKSSLNLGFNHGLCNDLKAESLSSCNFNDAQKKPSLKLGLNHGFGNDLKVESLSNCDFNDAKKIPNWRLGFNCNDSVENLSDSYVFVEKFEVEVEKCNSKPLWKLLSEEALLAKMDPNVAVSYQKALYNNNNRAICPIDVSYGYQKAFSDRDLGCNASSMMNKSVGSSSSSSLSPVSVKCKSVECSPVVEKSKLAEEDNVGVLAGCEDKVVLYFSSLRGIRKTYEDCCTVRLILRGCRVMVDERDISMDSSFRKELQSALGGKAFSLPQLFIRGKHVGGVDEIKWMHETGELERLLYGFPVLDWGFVCDNCGDVRFIPCSNCSGSRKVFLEEEGHTMRCPDCNENGLVRCSACCS